MNFRLILPMLLLFAAPAFAGAAAKGWISGNFSAASYAMTGVNADISRINSALAQSGLSMNLVTKGFSLGATAGRDLGHGLTVGVGYDRLFAHSRVTGASTSVSYGVPANLVRVLGRFAFVTGDKSNDFVELSIGRASTAGALSVSAPGIAPRSGSLTNSGIAYELGLGSREWISPRYAITGGFGYRHARSGGAHLTDYGGLFLRAGVTRALAK